MAKIIQTVSTIRFDDLDDLTKHALRHLKPRLIKHGHEEYSDLIGSLVSELINVFTEESYSMYGLIDNVQDALDEATTMRLGIAHFDVRTFLNYPDGEYAVNVAANFAGLHAVVRFGIVDASDADRSEAIGYMGADGFDTLLEKLSVGEVALTRINECMYIRRIKSPAIAGTCEVVSEVDMSEPNVSVSVAPASVTVRVPMSAEQRAGVDPVVEDFIDPMFQDFVGGPEKNGS